MRAGRSYYISEPLLNRIHGCVMEQYAQTGTVPKDALVESLTHINKSTVSRAWKVFVASGMVSDDLALMRRQNRTNNGKTGQRKKVVLNGSGPCRLETAEAICRLLKTDAEARALWVVLLRGGGRYAVGGARL